VKEYGGYFELETFRNSMLHDNALALNCGRKCFEYLIKARNIKRIKMPYYMCDCVFNAAEKHGVEISYYSVGKDFRPIITELKDDEWLYVMNYYGQLTSECLAELKKIYKRIIIDNAQAYFDMPIPDTDTLYTCRKFFGVADGAFLYTNSELDDDLPIDESFERMHFVLGRYERTASEFYLESAENNEFFTQEPIKKMSKLTNNLLHAIDYSFVAKRRTDNFRKYHEVLGEINQLELRVPEGAFAYPLMIDNGFEIRKELQQKKIYIPILWPNVIKDTAEDNLDYKFTTNILPLPCDQRYELTDIEYIIKLISERLNYEYKRKNSNIKSYDL